MMHLHRIALAAAVLALAAGCSGWGGKSTDYKGAQTKIAQPLEVPPELSSPSMEDRYAIPDPRAQTTFSAYNQRAANPGTPTAGTSTSVLPRVDSARMERYGDQRWLVVKGEPEKIWPLIREFWVDSGYPLTREDPTTGIMETDWFDDRSKIPDDFMSRNLGRIMPSLFSTPRRDKFRTRLEKGAEPGTTEVFVSNRQVEEVYQTSQQDHTVWQSRPADRELEAEMLTRMLVKFGVVETQQVAAKPATPGTTAPAPARAGQAPATPDSRNAVLENSGAGPLVVNDSFDRAWRRVGLALDRVGFTVEDRDRSKGLFFVRYIDPEADLQGGKKESWSDKLMFWKTAPKNQPQYRIHVSDAGASMSQVQVQDSKGGNEASSTGKKILTLLYEQLK